MPHVKAEEVNSNNIERECRSTTPRQEHRFTKYLLMRLLCSSFLAATVLSVGAWAQVNTAPPIAGVLGKVESVSRNSIKVQTQDGLVSVRIENPLRTYRQVPSDLSDVTPNSYLGIPSVKQANGTELAQLVLIFPPELKGAAEGSVITSPGSGATAQSRMTNGSASRPPAPTSRMTNGTVQTGGRTSLVLHYQGGSQTILVPANVPVHKVAPVKTALAVGDTVYAATTKQSDGTLATDKVFVFIEAASQTASK